jgi:hypothetical protein
MGFSPVALDPAASRRRNGIALIRQAHAEQTLEEGTRALPANLRGEIYLCATTVVQRIAAKRDHHPGKSGQRHCDLGSDRQGFTWFYRFALDRIQAARTNTKFGQDLRSSKIPAP